MNRLLDRTGNRKRIVVGSHDDSDTWPRFLRIRQIDLHRGRLFHTIELYITDQPDYFAPGRVAFRSAPLQPLADRVFARPDAVRERFVYDYYQRGFGGVSGAKRAASQQLHA